jgi:hypothetical protein
MCIIFKMKKYLYLKWKYIYDKEWYYDSLTDVMS